MHEIRTIVWGGRGTRTQVLHIEAPGCVVNIRRMLRDSDGHEVTSVTINADRAGGDEWKLADFPSYGHAINIRVRRESAE